ncbi:MAG: restriction endonuclease [Nitrososphaeria archaeon]|nr:restriction endonuclease [Nitrososphaeria archaeon]
MNYQIFLKIIPYFKEKFLDINKIVSELKLSKSVVLDILNPLINEGYIIISGDLLTLKEGSIIMASLLAIKYGASLDDVCKVVGWQDFENFIEKILIEYGYRTFRGFRLKRPRLEVDILALKKEFGLVVDCKHWRKSLSYSVLNSIVMKQVERAKIILLHERVLLQNKFLIPIIVTLYPSPIKFVNGVPIVPVEMFKSFINEVDGRIIEFLKVYLKDNKIFTII